MKPVEGGWFQLKSQASSLRLPSTFTCQLCLPFVVVVVMVACKGQSNSKDYYRGEQQLHHFLSLIMKLHPLGSVLVPISCSRGRFEVTAGTLEYVYRSNGIINPT